tara:strand:- start:406 stop:864 length:459 start_codon:yes stop_codon:yes gene_type:complete
MALTIQDFVNHINTAPLSACLRSIDKYNREHVWLVVGGKPVYHYYDKETVNALPLDAVIERVGAYASSSADGWECNTARDAASVEDIDIIRRSCLSQLDDYELARGSEAFLECEHGDECPLCENGTVEVTETDVTCRGECGATIDLEPTCGT